MINELAVLTGGRTKESVAVSSHIKVVDIIAHSYLGDTGPVVWPGGVSPHSF